MKKRKGIFLLTLFCLTGITQTIFAKDINYKEIDFQKISRYSENRIVFQHVEKQTSPDRDNSFETLFWIRDEKMYLLIDGYDDPEIVETDKKILDMENRLIPDLWKNKINGKPDFIKIADRRVVIMRKHDEKFVTENFDKIYKPKRDAFLRRHVDIFYNLMKDRAASELIVHRTPIPKEAIYNAPADEKTFYKIVAVAKSKEGKVYYAEDADGDGICETFAVSITDGFNWGFKSGPNIIFIYNNKDEGLKNIIGNLCNSAYYGTPAEEKAIIKDLSETFPTEEDIKSFVDYIQPPEK